jgi:hypothetical protein
MYRNATKIADNVIQVQGKGMFDRVVAVDSNILEIVAYQHPKLFSHLPKVDLRNYSPPK